MLSDALKAVGPHLRLLLQNDAMIKSMITPDAFEQVMMPMTHLLEPQRSMLESLAEEQTQLSTELMTDALEEARAVCNCESVPELMEVHKNFLQKYQDVKFKKIPRKWWSLPRSRRRHGLKSAKRR